MINTVDSFHCNYFVTSYEGGKKMKIIKRNGAEMDFDISKIIVAVSKANAACKKEELSQSKINEIAEYV